MKPPSPRLRRQAAILIVLLTSLTALSAAPARTKVVPRPAAPIYVSLVDQLVPQINRPAFNSLDERRRGPIFKAALEQVSQQGKLPPVIVINRDLSIPATVPDEPKLPTGTRLTRIYLTQWSQTRLGGFADTEVLCRLYVELVRDGRVEKKLGPFFAQKRYDTVTAVTPQDDWAQYQDSARIAIEQMAAVLGSTGQR